MREARLRRRWCAHNVGIREEMLGKMQKIECRGLGMWDNKQEAMYT